MLNIGIIGIGNTGNQIAALAKKRLAINVIAINSSDKDLETINDPDIPKKLLTNKDGMSQGAGKDRSLAKKYLKDSIMTLLQDKEIQTMVSPLDVVFIVSSTGGGTGSGTAPMLANIISETFKDTKCILIGVLPVNSEALSAHVNTLQYLDELYRVLNNQTYMLYDNDKYADLPSYQILEKINNEVVSDIDVIRCTYNYTSRFDTIDDRDMMRLISFPGRLVVTRVEKFQEKDCDNKSMEEMIIDKIKKNGHVEIQRDKKIMGSGIITNLSKNLTEEFNDDTPEVRKFSGDPVHAFKHIYVNEDRKNDNNIFYIMSGLTAVNDKIDKISDRVDEIEEAQKVLEEDNSLNGINLSDLTEQIADKSDDDGADQIDLTKIFNKFDV